MLFQLQVENIIDIITYDYLINRLENIIKEMKKEEIKTITSKNINIKKIVTDSSSLSNYNDSTTI